jgi:hypothetical protein
MDEDPLSYSVNPLAYYFVEPQEYYFSEPQASSFGEPSSNSDDQSDDERSDIPVGKENEEENEEEDEEDDYYRTSYTKEEALEKYPHLAGDINNLEVQRVVMAYNGREPGTVREELLEKDGTITVNILRIDSNDEEIRKYKDKGFEEYKWARDNPDSNLEYSETTEEARI